MNPTLVFVLSTIWTEGGTRLCIYNASLSAAPPTTQTHMFAHRHIIARQAWHEPQNPAETERCWPFDSVSVELTSLLLTSETLSNHWSRDLTLSKSFALAAMHCWVLKVSSLKSRGSFLLNSCGLRQHSYKHLAKDGELSQVKKFLNAPITIINIYSNSLPQPPYIYFASFNTLLRFIRHICFD